MCGRLEPKRRMEERRVKTRMVRATTRHSAAAIVAALGCAAVPSPLARAPFVPRPSRSSMPACRRRPPRLRVRVPPGRRNLPASSASPWTPFVLARRVAFLRAHTATGSRSSYAEKPSCRACVFSDKAAPLYVGCWHPRRSLEETIVLLKGNLAATERPCRRFLARERRCVRPE